MSRSLLLLEETPKPYQICGHSTQNQGGMSEVAQNHYKPEWLGFVVRRNHRNEIRLLSMLNLWGLNVWSGVIFLSMVLMGINMVQNLNLGGDDDFDMDERKDEQG